VRAPKGIGSGKIKVTVTFADWKDGKVIPATFGVEQGPNNPAPYEFAKEDSKSDARRR
jgi:hypothetical protein